MPSGHRTTAEQGRHRRRKDRGTKASPISRINAAPSFPFLFLASLIVGNLLIGSSSVLAAEEDSLSNPSENTNDLGGDAATTASVVESCNQATVQLMSDESEASQNLQNAIETHSAAMESSMTDEEWSFGFSVNDSETYQNACTSYDESVAAGNVGVIWTAQDDRLKFTCDMPQMKVTGKKVELYGIGECLANTVECRAVTPMSLAKLLWENVGLECSATTNTTGNATAGVDESDDETSGNQAKGNLTKDENDGANNTTNTASEEKNDAENLSPGDETDSGDKLPFLTDDDVVCMTATAEYVKKDAGLASAIATFKDSQILKNDKETDVEVMGYPVEAAKTMKSACELKKGHWAFVKSMNFTCIIEGMETVPLHAFNFGSCLARTDACVAMDTTSVLRAELSDDGFNCWEDEEDKSGSAASSNGAGSETDNINDSAKGENIDQDIGQDIDQDSSDIFDDMMLGLSESDQKCMTDTAILDEEHPLLTKATNDFGASMKLVMGDIKDMLFGFTDANVEKLRAVCNDSTIGGYFSLIEKKEFICDMMSVEADLKLTNIANCLADTPECRNMNALLLMEDIWTEMGLTCRDKTETDGEDTTPTMNDNDSDSKESDKDDTLVKDLALTESEVTCMTESTSFINSSDVLSNATLVYQKSVQMTDPTKLGYTAASASEMEEVCEEQGGLWSVIESEDVTCIIQGRERCINVYNFGNCIANNDNCQSMDPMVLVRGFFMEVLKFSCRAKCDRHKDTNGHSAGHPSSSGSNNNNNLSSNQQNTTIGSGNLPKFVPLAFVLFLVVAVGFFGFYRYRTGNSERESSSRRAYEMTQISDLGFRTIS